MTPTETKARYLFNMVYGYVPESFNLGRNGWLKLARRVMRLEKKAKRKL